MPIAEPAPVAPRDRRADMRKPRPCPDGALGGRLTRRSLALALIFTVQGCASPYLVTIEDVVCPVGDKAKLIGKLEYRGLGIWNKGLDDRDLEFHLDGQLVGDDQTNDEGYAKVKRRFDSPGVRRLEVRYADRRGNVHRATASVFVWGRDDPILVVDIDQTVCDTKKRYLLGDGVDRSKPLPGAVEVLNELAGHFHVVYLTARPREMAVKTRRWLNDRGFPSGPVLHWDIDEYEFSATEYKKDRLDDLKDDFDQVNIGIGNAEGDHTAYRKRKLLTILVNPDEPPALIDRGVRLPDWPSVRRLFAANPQLYEPDLSYKTRVVLPRP